MGSLAKKIQTAILATVHNITSDKMLLTGNSFQKQEYIRLQTGNTEMQNMNLQ